MKFHNTEPFQLEPTFLEPTLSQGPPVVVDFCHDSLSLNICEEFCEGKEMTLCMDINLVQLDVLEKEHQLDICEVDKVWTTPNPYEILQDEYDEKDDDNSLSVIRISTPKAKSANTPINIPKSTERRFNHPEDILTEVCPLNIDDESDKPNMDIILGKLYDKFWGLYDNLKCRSLFFGEIWS